MDAIVGHILALPAWVALLVVFLLPALESSAFIGFIFPGETALILGGVLAAQGVLPVWSVLAAGIAGAVIGDSTGYMIGRRYGHRLLHGTIGRLVKRKHLDRGERFLAARGGKAVFLGRFTAALRVLIPGLSGMAGMPYRTFVAYNVAGGVCWGTMCVLLGYLGGSSWRHAAQLASRTGLVAIGIIVALIIAGYLLRRSGRFSVVRAADRLRRSRVVTRVASRYPGPTGWIARRFAPRRVDGLTLTALVAVAVGATWVVLGITEGVLEHEGVAAVDHRAMTWIVAHRSAWLTAALRPATWLGSSAVLIPVLTAVAILLARFRRSWQAPVMIAATYVWTVLSYSVMKSAVRRPRPPMPDWLAGASGWSFPSGHAAQAAAAWGIVGALVCVGRCTRTKALLGAAAAAIALLVAFSRWYLGVHWLSDVITGLAVGVVVLSLVGIAATALTATGVTIAAQHDTQDRT